MPAPHGLHPLAKALLIRHSLRPTLPALCALALTLPMIGQAQAQTAAINIPAQSLGSALQEFGRQTNLQVLYSPDEVSGLHSTAVNGNLEPAAAMAQLLQGTGIAYSVDGNSVALRARSSGGNTLDLAPTSISATQESAYGPVDGIVAKRSGTGTKTDTPLNEIPQTVNVITADEVKMRGAQSVSEALRYTAGMTGGGFSDRVKMFDEPTSRGFSPTPLYLDGLHLPYGGGSTGGSLQIDPYTLERIEVLKGPASVLYGQNQPGGIVNMVGKRPTATPLHEIVLGGGSYDRKYGAFDLGGPIDDQGEFLYRLTGLVNDSNSEIDYADQNRMLLAPSLTWLPNDRTSVTVFAQYQKDRDTPEAQGLPAEGTVYKGPNGRISRKLFIGEPGLNKYDREQFVTGYDVSYELNDVWTFKQRGSYAYLDDQYVAPLHGYSFPTNPVTGRDDNSYQSRFGVDWSQTNKVYGIDSTAQAKFKTGELDHTVLLGVDYYHFNTKFLGLYDRQGPGIDLYHPVYGSEFNFTQPYRWDNTIKQTGLYAQDQLRWNQWFLTLGGRYDFAETDNKEPLAGTHSNIKDEKFTGRAGLGYEFENGLTPYVSYSESFLPQTGVDMNSKPFKPTTGKQYEVGVKYEPTFVDGFIQLSAYQIDQDNMLTNDLQNPGFSSQSGSVRSRGVELEGKVNVTQNLRVLAAVSRNQNKWRSVNDGREGRTLAMSPPLTASTWVNYDFDTSTVLSGLGAGIGLRYVRSSYGSDYEEDSFQIPSYTVYDAMVSYDLQKSPLHIKGTKLKLNLENLQDKKYVASCNSTLDCYYGEGRTVTADVTYNW
ncbi:TonB-dependent siderophore receptor [Pseudomonas frederiksbergensis]|uniref:Metal-pseudopaline receptor CntO n=1 Tax=Pseudomonas frederiksbergensis TaxID=104087 RepID=A0A423K667_9PSED|nr:TonB-dependent siderophore receptor [Pseudomonas frederiksbergensis]RON47137.1 TonB-dependent receptor [Pseudomonas frederiksbergensis]